MPTPSPHNDPRYLPIKAAIRDYLADLDSGEPVPSALLAVAVVEALREHDAVQPPPFLTFRDLGFGLPPEPGDPPYLHKVADDAVVVANVYVVPAPKPGEPLPSRLSEPRGVNIRADFEQGVHPAYIVRGPGPILSLDDEDADARTPNLRAAVRAARKILAAVAAREQALSDVEIAAAEARAIAGSEALAELDADLRAEGLL